MPQYSQEQLWKLFETLPQELKDAILSEDTANTIREISQRYGIKEEEIPQFAALVGDILMGLLPPEELPVTLERELNIDTETAEKISKEVNRFILFPVKDSLVEFYKEIRFAPGGRLIKPEKEKKEKRKKEIGEELKKEEKPYQPDIYREPIE